MTQKNRTLSLLRTLGSTAVRAGAEALKNQLSGNASKNAAGAAALGGLEMSQAALRLVRGLDELKGAAMKMGQLLSLVDDTMLPQGWKQALVTLQSQATAKPFAEVEPLLRAELPHYENHLVSLEPEAVHAASIGQVHRGVLANGTRVAVKIRYPDLEKWVRSDIVSLRRMLRLANAIPSDGDFDAVFAQVEKIFLQEIDFAQEAANYVLYREHFASAPGVVVPRVIAELSTRNVLVTEWVDGLGLDAWMSTPSQEGATPSTVTRTAESRAAVSAHILRVLFEELFVLGRVQSDPNPANFLVTPEGKLALLDFGATQALPLALVEGYRALSRACLQGTKPDILAVSEDMGFLKPSDSQAGRDAFVSMLAIATEPFEHGEFDFGTAKLVARMRGLGVTFVREVGFRPPPPEIVFLNRRILGTQLKLERLAASFDARAVLMPHLKTEE
jgi:aarF domain-containing kinase